MPVSTDEVTASLLHQISQILLVQGLSAQQVKKALAELLLRFSENRFDSAMSRAEFYKTISAASHLLGDMLPNALDVVRRGAKGFTHEVRSVNQSEYGKAEIDSCRRWRQAKYLFFGYQASC